MSKIARCPFMASLIPLYETRDCCGHLAKKCSVVNWKAILFGAVHGIYFKLETFSVNVHYYLLKTNKAKKVEFV
jgi:hypothetical protein